MEHEIWKPVKGYEGLYEVSSLGRIKSLIIPNYREKEIIMTPTLHGTGYNIIGLTKAGKQKIFRFHRIVAFHFCEKKKGCDVVNHLNGIKTDNKAINLEWTTVSGNTSHSFKMGLQKARMGEESNFSVLNKENILDIRSKYETKQYTQKELGRLFNISREAVSLIVNRKRWAHI